MTAFLVGSNLEDAWLGRLPEEGCGGVPGL